MSSNDRGNSRHCCTTITRRICKNCTQLLYATKVFELEWINKTFLVIYFKIVLLKDILKDIYFKCLETCIHVEATLADWQVSRVQVPEKLLLSACHLLLSLCTTVRPAYLYHNPLIQKLYREGVKVSSCPPEVS